MVSIKEPKSQSNGSGKRYPSGNFAFNSSSEIGVNPSGIWKSGR
jgi:hypothetical protein